MIIKHIAESSLALSNYFIINLIIV